MGEVVQLLQQIADNTARNESAWVAAVSGGAAVLGASVSAIFSYFVARKSAQSQEQIGVFQLRATIVTSERLRWLQDIRQRLSHLYAQMDMQYSHLKRSVQPGEVASMQQTLDRFSAEIMEQSNIITLMLNPQKRNQANLRNALQASLQFLLQHFSQKGGSAAPIDDAKYASLKQAAFDSLTAIGTETWKQIKALQ